MILSPDLTGKVHILEKYLVYLKQISLLVSSGIVSHTSIGLGISLVYGTCPKLIVDRTEHTS